MRNRIAPVLALLCVSHLFAASDDRAQTLEKRLLAPCCWSESLAEHHSETASKMRAEIGEFIAQGKSDREILDIYIGQYGKRILVEPEGTTGMVLRLTPVLATCAGLAALLLLMIRVHRREKLASHPL